MRTAYLLIKFAQKYLLLNAADTLSLQKQGGSRCASCLPIFIHSQRMNEARHTAGNIATEPCKCTLLFIRISRNLYFMIGFVSLQQNSNFLLSCRSSLRHRNKVPGINIILTFRSLVYSRVLIDKTMEPCCFCPYCLLLSIGHMQTDILV